MLAVALTLVLVGLGVAAAGRNWRWGVLMTIVVGVLQDPLRKMMPGAPAVMVLAFFPVWAMTVTMALGGRDRAWRQMRRGARELSDWVAMLPLALVPGIAVTLGYGLYAWPVAVIGILSYMMPASALLIGFAYPKSSRHLRRAITAYCLFTALVLVGGPLQYAGMFAGSPLLGTAVFDTEWIRHISYGHWIRLIAGFYRSPDLMGWHASALVMLSLTMLIRPGERNRWLWALLITWGGICLLISGRNKMIFMPLVWAAAVISIHMYAGRTSHLGPLLLGAILAVAGVGLASDRLNVEDDYFRYLNYGGSTIVERLQKDSLKTIRGTFNQSGFWGQGLGTASQGRQHLGIDFKGGWQEGGLGKIIAELGVMGMLLALMVCVAVVVQLHKSVRTVVRRAPKQLAFHAGLLGFVAANVAMFLNSHLPFSDGCVVIITAMMIGIALAAPRWLINPSVGIPPPRMSSRQVARPALT